MDESGTGGIGNCRWSLSDPCQSSGKCREHEYKENKWNKRGCIDIWRWTKPGMYERFTGRAEGAQCQSNLFCDRRESRGISGFDKENSGWWAYHRKSFLYPCEPWHLIEERCLWADSKDQWCHLSDYRGISAVFAFSFRKHPEESGLSDEYDRGALGCRPKGLGGTE